ncbi:MAG TPA: AIR synthase-related protein, partial [Deinococcales bacterium]|nr:AIR synthase-related protein [Deinococcales bacterium]
SEHERPAVQVGDPYLEKLLMEATLEAIEAGLVAGVQDMGAAGLLSSTSEMAHRAGLGTDLHLDLVPVREDGMQPWELILSESQERMILVPVPGREQELTELLERWELDWADVGEVTDHGRYRLYWHGELVCDLDVGLLNEAPLRQLEGRPDAAAAERRGHDLSGLPEPADYGDALLQLLASPTIAGKHALFERFDQQALNNTVTGPGSADAAVLRVPGTDLGVAAAIDCNPRWVALDPYRGAAAAVAEAARNVACTGATPLALTNNLNFGNPERPEVFWQMQEAVRGIAAAARVLDTPVTGGNVSLNNQYLHGGETTAILPTPTIGVVGVLPDIEQRADLQLPEEEAGVYLIGRFRPVAGGSAWLALAHDLEAGEPPEVDLKHDLKTIEAVLGLIRNGLTATAHDLSDGGLAVALAELAVANRRGLSADVPSADLPLSTVLFGEGSGLVLVAVTPENRAEAEEMLDRLGAWWQRLGETGGGTLRLSVDGRTAADVPVEELARAYEGVFPPLLTGWKEL